MLLKMDEIAGYSKMPAGHAGPLAGHEAGLSGDMWVDCVAEAMLEKKAGHVVSMDLRQVPGASFDFYVLGEASSGPQARAIADEIERKMHECFHVWPLHVEGYANAEWVLLDFGGIVAHVFLDSVRRHYRIEELWGDALVQHYNNND